MIPCAWEQASVHPALTVSDFVLSSMCRQGPASGSKASQRFYRHSATMAASRPRPLSRPWEAPEQVIERAVRGMLPKTTLGRQQLKKLKIYAGAEHPHAAQNPTKIDLEA